MIIESFLALLFFPCPRLRLPLPPHPSPPHRCQSSRPPPPPPQSPGPRPTPPVTPATPHPCPGTGAVRHRSRAGELGPAAGTLVVSSSPKASDVTVGASAPLWMFPPSEYRSGHAGPWALLRRRRHRGEQWIKRRHRIYWQKVKSASSKTKQEQAKPPGTQSTARSCTNTHKTQARKEPALLAPRRGSASPSATQPRRQAA
ncbi:hypothetical protein GUITHDRAFT_69016 [Guillardia theta CCMP2712]|uniref:Uncharacterized protein n=1 Tax=Guillardia theta (strain CCMP2712) TaxID=905079 RepID=L1JIR0_GUITC|nr:hypothetical protein GUITHDRAFT_69016 [Guillardia theta CCMP2712]EKX48039.1 hypothetical protein GUITHDRAFT_69016 [Guillardia theta CCMP2712]|eukprot:XP_005835019.1 hypothetical protein GUITHDRAFT_69016 [Guillardia theta CCMP2712]